MDNNNAFVKNLSNMLLTTKTMMDQLRNQEGFGWDEETKQKVKEEFEKNGTYEKLDQLEDQLGKQFGTKK